MRCYKFILAVFLALGLSACAASDAPRSSSQEVVTPPPASAAVTPSADMSADAAIGASQAAEAEIVPDPFPGTADIIPTITAVTEFCNRSGSLAYMTRDGCRGALVQLSHDIFYNTHFASMEDCQDFLHTLQADRNDIIEAHREWCMQRYDNLHDRKGCYDAAPAFLDSFSEQGFCRKLPPPKPKAKRPVDIEAPYLYGYSEPGQKFDKPKTGKLPTAIKAAPVKKPVVQKPVSVKPVTTAPPAPPVPVAPQPAPKPAPLVAPQPTPPAAPAAVEAPKAPPAAPSPAAPAAAPKATAEESMPRAQDLLSQPAPVEQAPQAQPPQTQSGPALPAPVFPVTGSSATQSFPEPIIGPKEEIEALPPVPSIGRIAPQLMPGVPPDTAVSDNTLPAETESPQITEAPQGSPLGADAFGDIIPNFMPPPPPNPLEAQPQALPVSGAPAGQAAP